MNIKSTFWMLYSKTKIDTRDITTLQRDISSDMRKTTYRATLKWIGHNQPEDRLLVRISLYSTWNDIPALTDSYNLKETVKTTIHRIIV